MLNFSHSLGTGRVNPLEEYVNILRRRFWLVAGFAVGCAVVAAIWSYSTTPVYQGKATVVIEREGPGALDRDKSIPQDISPEYFQTHFELMKSRQVLQRTAQLLDLQNQPEYQAQPSRFKATVYSLLPAFLVEVLEPKGGNIAKFLRRKRRIIS